MWSWGFGIFIRMSLPTGSLQILYSFNKRTCAYHVPSVALSAVQWCNRGEHRHKLHCSVARGAMQKTDVCRITTCTHTCNCNLWQVLWKKVGFFFRFYLFFSVPKIIVYAPNLVLHAIHALFNMTTRLWFLFLLFWFGLVLECIIRGSNLPKQRARMSRLHRT